MFNVQDNVLLSQHTTFRVGGKAKHFIKITNKEELLEALRFIKETKLPFFVLGGGSNILVSDDGIDGVVLKMETKGITFEEQGNNVVVTAEAGEVWDDVVQKTVEKGYSGIEYLSWIPGTVGGAPAQNIGAYGKEFKDVCESVDVINIETGEEQTFSKEDNKFQYRNSFWKTQQGKKYIITRVRMNLEKKSSSEIVYKDLKEYFEKRGGEITPASVREAVIYIRKNKLPDVNALGTAGSFFKNPVITKEKYEELKKMYPLLPMFDAPNNMAKIPAAWVLDNVCHLKGYRKGNVGLYEKQPLAVVNFSNNNEKEVVRFVKEISEIFFNATKINLEWEVIHIS